MFILICQCLFVGAKAGWQKSEIVRITPGSQAMQNKHSFQKRKFPALALSAPLKKGLQTGYVVPVVRSIPFRVVVVELGVIQF